MVEFQHIPNPKPWEEWTADDEVKFRIFANHCPMCQYKYQYAALHRLVAAVNETQDETLAASMAPDVQRKSQELIELGLFIATTVDNANTQAGQAGHN
jgi:hypothetical protein